MWGTLIRNLPYLISVSVIFIKYEVCAEVTCKTVFLFRVLRRTSSSLMQRSTENDIVLMNEVYKERFPAAAAQMEEKLTELVSRISTDMSGMGGGGATGSPSSAPATGAATAASGIERDGAGRFVAHHILEMARDCLEKSQQKLVTARYLYHLVENLEHLLADVCQSDPTSSNYASRTLRVEYIKVPLFEGVHLESAYEYDTSTLVLCSSTKSVEAFAFLM